MFHYARLTRDFEHSEVEGPEVFHFVAVNGEDDWIEVQISEPLRAEHEPTIRVMIEEHFSENVTCEHCGAQADSWEDDVDHKPDCQDPKVYGTLPVRITRRFLRLQGADFVEIGEAG